MSWRTGFEHFIVENEPLAGRCWLRLGGPAEYFAEPTTEQELIELVSRCRAEDVAVRLMGGGSNVLIGDEGLKGVTIGLGATDFATIQVNDQFLTAGGGAGLPHVISSAAREGLAGLEPLVGIPGTVGGALHGNAGDRATDVGSWVDRVTVLTRNGEVLTRGAADMTFSYRRSSLNELAILSATFKLEPDDRDQLTRRLQKLWIMKRSRQPSSEHRTGCLFKDPIGMTAAELIEQAGLKAASSGGASLYDRDPNFVMLQDPASSQDVLRLIDEVRQGVAQQMGVDLETAIQIW